MWQVALYIANCAKVKLSVYNALKVISFYQIKPVLKIALKTNKLKMDNACHSAFKTVNLARLIKPA